MFGTSIRNTNLKPGELLIITKDENGKNVDPEVHRVIRKATFEEFYEAHKEYMDSITTPEEWKTDAESSGRVFYQVEDAVSNEATTEAA